MTRLLSRFLLIGLLTISLTGCTNWWPHSLRPSQLWKLNRAPARNTNPFFSVSDPIPEQNQPSTDR